MKFYVYVHYRPDGRPFYVGKGTAKRYRVALQPNGGSQHKNPILRQVIRKIERSGQTVDTKIVARFETEEEAFALECLLIKQFGRIDLKTGPLANMTDGGDGLAGLSPESKAKQPRFKPGQTYTPERNAKVSAWHTGRPKSEAAKAKLSETNRNRELTPAQLAVLEKMAQDNVGRTQSDEVKERKNAKLRGRKRTPDQLINIRAAAARRPSRKGIPKSQEAREKMSAGASARWARDRTPRTVKGPDGKFVKTSLLPGSGDLPDGDPGLLR